jgi:hypothetical protein
MAVRIGQFFKDLFSLETAEGAAGAAKATFDLAEQLQQPEIQQLGPIVQQGGSLLAVLNSPLGELLETTLPFVKVATGLLKFYLKVTHTEPTLAEAVALISQAAYLESLQVLVSRSPKFQAWLKQRGSQPAPAYVQQQFQQLDTVEVDERTARLTLLYFQESPLATAFNQVLTARLTGMGLKPEQANQVVERVARDTNQYILPALAELSHSAAQLVQWYQMGGREVFEKYFSIDAYLEEVIRQQPLEAVFNEGFTFRDIYVPLKAQPLTQAGEPDRNRPVVILEDWAQQFLADANRKDQVMFIQAEPGRGKSTFCRIFADWVRRHEHPRWTPILIRLRDLRLIESDFEETLRNAVDRDFAETDRGWLNDRNTRFLFLLDGFDELLLEGSTSGGLEHFLQQVSWFQQSCARNSEKDHRVLITGRTLALQSIERSVPVNFERIEILPLDADLQAQWFAKWERLVGAEKTHAFQQFLQDDRCPDRIHGPEGLAQEPLLLYLLAAMHRDGKLQIEMFEGAEGAKAKILIYERSLDWVLTQQRSDSLQWHISDLEQEGLRILMEAGLCVVQAGGEWAPIAMIESRLNDDRTKVLLAEVRQHLNANPLQNALASFYLRSRKGKVGSVEFAHKSFGEFLCAKRIKEALEDWTRPGRRSQFEVSTERLHWKIYDLLGAPVLTPEIVEYLMALLAESSEFRPEVLFARLHEVYQRWCGGKFIDALSDNLPQRKVRLLRTQLTDHDSLLGLRQVDIYSGFNVMILMLKLHCLAPLLAAQSVSQRTDLTFYPCEPPDTDAFDKTRLLQLIGYGECIGIGAFREIVGPFLSYANLSQVNLNNLDLSSVDLSHANLDNANLFNTDLSSANLSKATLNSADLRDAYLSNADLSNVDLVAANLADADLSNADLFDVNLRNANLTNADLSNADLSNADLSSTNLSHADFSHAILEDIQWDETTCWEGVRGLDQAINLPEALQQLNHYSPTDLG